MIKKIGITGPSGSGKSLLCEYLKKENIACIDADALYHSMLIPPSRLLDAIRDTFGEDIISSDGTLDRAILATKVFYDAGCLQKLNDTVLPIVISEISNIMPITLIDNTIARATTIAIRYATAVTDMP